MDGQPGLILELQASEALPQKARWMIPERQTIREVGFWQACAHTHRVKFKKKRSRGQKGGEREAVTRASKLGHRGSLTKPQLPSSAPLTSNTVYSQEYLYVLVRVSIVVAKHHDQKLLKKERVYFL